MIKEWIEALPEEDALLALLAAFDKLLKKYARLLEYEDAYEELRLFFIELIYGMKQLGLSGENDGVYVGYISTAVKNKYIYLAQKAEREAALFLSNLRDESHEQERCAAIENPGKISDYFPVRNRLTSREEEILYLLFVCGYSVSEIAGKYKISRQTVNKSKLRALRKIRMTVIGNG